jgi:hypothetical protein
MNRTFRARLTTASASIEGGLFGLIREMAPVVLFFFVAFLLIFVIFKLFVSQYEIEFSAFSRAAVAALILGKVIPFARLGAIRLPLRYPSPSHRDCRQDLHLWSGRDHPRDR